MDRSRLLGTPGSLSLSAEYCCSCRCCCCRLNGVMDSVGRKRRVSFAVSNNVNREMSVMEPRGARLMTTDRMNPAGAAGRDSTRRDATRREIVGSTNEPSTCRTDGYWLHASTWSAVGTGRLGRRQPAGPALPVSEPVEPASHWLTVTSPGPRTTANVFLAAETARPRFYIPTDGWWRWRCL